MLLGHTVLLVDDVGHGRKVWPRLDFREQSITGTLRRSHLPMAEERVVAGDDTIPYTVLDEGFRCGQHFLRR